MLPCLPPPSTFRPCASPTITSATGAGAEGVRSRCFLNGVPTSVRVLREVGRLLVDVNGQHAALALK